MKYELTELILLNLEVLFLGPFQALPLSPARLHSAESILICPLKVSNYKTLIHCP